MTVLALNSPNNGQVDKICIELMLHEGASELRMHRTRLCTKFRLNIL